LAFEEGREVKEMDEKEIPQVSLGFGKKVMRRVVDILCR